MSSFNISAKTVWIVIFLAATAGTRAGTAEDPLPRIRLYELRLDSLKFEHNRYLSEASLIAERMKLYQSRESLNAREHANLGKLLRRSMELEQSVSGLRQDVDRLLSEYDNWQKSELKIIQEELNQFSQTEADIPESRKNLARVQSLLDWKSELENRLKPLSLNTHSGLELTLDREASARELRLRGDMLLDREEIFRREIQQIDERIESLLVEAKVRRKVLEMTEDMDLFDEEEELFGEKSRPVTSGAMAADNAYNYWNEAESREGFLDDGKSIPPGSEDSRADPAFTADPSLNLEFRTPEAIESAAHDLSSLRDRLQFLADSLETRSRQFYNEAEQKAE